LIGAGADQTIVDASSLGRTEEGSVVKVSLVFPWEDAHFCGIAFVGGDADQAGGIYAGADIYLYDCVIRGNHAVDGGGIFGVNAVELCNCLRENNQASGCDGGLYAESENDNWNDGFNRCRR
jgi:hypothetical protein